MDAPIECSIFNHTNIARSGEVFEAGALERAEADSLQLAVLSECDVAQSGAAQERERGNFDYAGGNGQGLEPAFAEALPRQLCEPFVESDLFQLLAATEGVGGKLLEMGWRRKLFES